jgi:hypothetical protein
LLLLLLLRVPRGAISSGVRIYVWLDNWDNFPLWRTVVAAAACEREGERIKINKWVL